VADLREVTAFDAGFSGDEQIRTALQRIIGRGGEAQMADLYEAVNDKLRPLGCACRIKDGQVFDFS
jgi:hypothetical protein